MPQAYVSSIAIAAFLVLTPAGHAGLRLVGTPYAVPTRVSDTGAVLTAWGEIAAVPETQAPDRGRHDWAPRPSPAPVTEFEDRGLRLTVAAFRAPLWPTACDVLTVTARNTGTERLRSGFRLRHPETLARNGNLLVSGGMGRVALAPPQMVVGSTGCLTAAEAMPGWARPNRACDPGFANIRAGMGGVPIHYRFALDKADESVGVVLGFCESHWAEPGKRPVRIAVEGAELLELDPVLRFGHHVPGTVAVKGSDQDGDAAMDIRVLPVEGAEDVNPILNVIWVFPSADTPPEPEVLLGHHNAAALYRVDVGGPDDGPSLRPAAVRSEPGSVVYELNLRPGEEAEFMFLLALADGTVPAWEATSWTPAAVSQAADRVWEAWLSGAEARVRKQSPEALQLRAALATVAMTLHHIDAFQLPMGSLDRSPTSFSLAGLERVTDLLERNGLHTEAERCLRPLWDTPVPAPLEACCARENGLWSRHDHAANAHALVALCRHGLDPGNRDWARTVLPVVREAAGNLRTAVLDPQQGLSAKTRDRCTWGLRSAAGLIRALGDDTAATALEQDLRTTGEAPSEAAYRGLGPVVDQVNAALRMTAE